MAASRLSSLIRQFAWLGSLWLLAVVVLTVLAGVSRWVLRV